MNRSPDDDFTLPSVSSGFNRQTASGSGGTGITYLDGHGQIVGELPPGYIVGQQFRVRNTLGEGGMSTVYLCDDIPLNRQVALKVMRAGTQSNDQAFMRFHREGQAVAMLSHNNIVKVHSLQFTESDQPFLVMEVVQGVPLSDLLEVSGPLRLPRAIKFLMQICDGISHAHANGVIHRDLKLSNIMLINPNTPDESVKILDFGIAKVVTETSVKMTQTGEVFGSPAYMSPEQALGKAVDEKTDQYSLGCIAFELLTGRTPFAAENYLAVLMAHVQEQAPSINEFLSTPAPVGIERTIAKLLAKNPQDRFASIEEVKKALKGELKVAKPVAVKVQKKIDLRLAGIVGASLLTVGAIATLVYIMSPSLFSKPHQTIRNERSFQSEGNAWQMVDEATPDGFLYKKIESNKNIATFHDDLAGSDIKDRGLSFLTSCHNLRSLNIQRCRSLTPAGLAVVSQLPVQNLVMNKTKTNDDVLKEVSKMKNLTQLSVDGCDITDKGISYLRTLPRLTYLSIADNELTADVLKTVSEFHNLTHLLMDNADVASGLHYITKLPLQFLSISGINPKSEDLMCLGEMKTLVEIHMDSDSVDKKVLFELAKLPRLRTINVQKSAISASTVAKFKSLNPRCKLIYSPDRLEKD